MTTDIASRFAQEIRSQQEEGRQFAREYPEAAKFLDSENVDDRDPYVERLVESFIFLTSRARESFEAMGDGLEPLFLELVGADLDEPIPALMTVEFLPRRSLTGSARIEQGIALESGAVREPIRWSLLADHHVHPLVLRSVQVRNPDPSRSVLEWTMEWFSPSTPPRWPDSLRLYLHGDASVAWALRFALLRRLVRVEMLDDDGSWKLLDQVRFRPAVFPGYCSRGSTSHPFAMMRDFLCADEQSRFLELEGLDGFPFRSPLSLRFHLAESMPRFLAKAVQAANFRFHAAIAINRFGEGHCTFHCDHTRSEIVLRPEGGGDREILRVITVDGLENQPVPTRVRYQRHDLFRHGTGEGRFFRTRRGMDRAGQSHVFLFIAHRRPDHPLQDTFLTVTAQYCDGNRPYRTGTVRDLRAKSLPRGVGVMGLSRPGMRLMPAEHLPEVARFLPLAAAHFQGIVDVGRLRDLLKLWLWDPGQSKLALVESIQSVEARTGHVRVGGVAFPLETIHLRLRDTTCAPDTWERLGLVDAFGVALAELFAERVPLGFRSRLLLEVEPCGIVLEFGQRC